MTDKSVIEQALADAQVPTFSDEGLKSISVLAERQVYLEGKLEEAEQIVSGIKAQLIKVRDELLPEAMLAANCKEHKLADGTKIQIDKIYYAEVAKKNQEAFFKWLAENDSEGIVNAEVVIKLGKGRYDDAVKLAESLQAQTNEFEPIASGSIHWATLRAFAKEWLEDEDNPPLSEFLKVHPINRAKVKKGK